MLAARVFVASAVVFAMGCASNAAPEQQQGPSCGAGTVVQNGVCVARYTPPPGQSLGSGATIYFWASASAGGRAQGKIYAIVNGFTQGQMTGYATSGNPQCGQNAIFSVIVGAAPGKSYTLSAHDETTNEWAAQTTPVLAAGQCYAFQLN